MTARYRKTIIIAAVIAGLTAIPAVYAGPAGDKQGTMAGPHAMFEQNATTGKTAPGHMMGGDAFTGQTPMMMGGNMMTARTGAEPPAWMHNMFTNIPADQRAFMDKMMQQHGFNQPGTK